jgi:hypothetical protein
MDLEGDTARKIAWQLLNRVEDPKMDLEGDTARKIAWQLLNRVEDPNFSPLQALGVPVEELVAERERK